MADLGTPRQLPPRPNVRHLKDQAADLRRDFAYGEPEAVERVRASYSRAALATAEARELQVATALFIIAREYGFESWSALKQRVEAAAIGATTIKENIMATTQEIESIKQQMRRAARLQQEAGALTQEITDLIRQAKERIASIKRMGQPFETPPGKG